MLKGQIHLFKALCNQPPALGVCGCVCVHPVLSRSRPQLVVLLPWAASSARTISLDGYCNKGIL